MHLILIYVYVNLNYTISHHCCFTACTFISITKPRLLTAFPYQRLGVTI